ncbi:MAG: cytochrome c oxidase assembly protein [Alphaproteobacteria bacterium]|nr:cytochrome c oxidase assembly protein [Alphaproteobacteria bacterium]
MVQRKNQQRRTLFFVIAILTLMTGIVAYSPTLYRIFCAITGYGGTTQTIERPSNQDGVADMQNRITGNQTSALGNIVINFDSNLNGNLPWNFYPQAADMEVPIGETAVAYYHVDNNSDNETFGQAVFNVTPHLAGSYFVKIDCFCFSEQSFKGGESRALPVDFYIDPEIVNDPDLQGLTNITLSYTFYSLYDENIPEMEHGNHHDSEMEGMDHAPASNVDK